MKLTTLILTVLIYYLSIEKTDASLNWLSIAKLKNLNNLGPSVCDKLVGWTRSQKRFCKQYFGFTETIKRAARLTLDECSNQFKNRRWNCSTLRPPYLFARLPEAGIREASFLYALSSAALTYSITSACSEGRLTGCSCDETRRGLAAEGFRWSGCSDNIAYGMGVAENFLDPRVKNRTNLMLVNLHNLETGRQVIEKNMIKQCKCLGVSCELKTCTRTMPPFSVIAAKLKEKYDSAVEVELKKNANTRMKMTAKNQLFRKLNKLDLIYLNRSPDFCQANRRLASYGTHGRVCNKASRGIDSCDLLCCGRPYKTTFQIVKYKCNCTFEWCCSVKCSECQSIQEVTTCT